MSDLRRPRNLAELIGWYRREWSAEIPTRMHVRGVEPESRLGSPKMAPAMTARLAAIEVSAMADEAREQARKVAMATDHDNALDTYRDGDAPLTPMLAALTKFGRWYPWTRDFIYQCTYVGWDWQHIGWQHKMPAEATAFFLERALDRLYSIWTRLDSHEVTQTH